MWNLKYDTNEPIYKAETDSQTKRTDFWLPRGRAVGRDGLGVWVGRCKLLHIEWMDKRVLLYSTGNCIQRHGINHKGKEYKKEYIYIHTHTHTSEIGRASCRERV